MARTKRRYEKKLKDVEQEKSNYRAGIYIRLSNERTETYRPKSSSIDAQEFVCKKYANEQNIIVTNVYVDYEKTGTDFNRAGYQEMMTDVRNGTINCIIIRDLSRLGRAHLEMGRLIDKVFPVLGVRFISVNDNLDTEKGVSNEKSFEVILKNIINDMYSKDLSKKIKTSKINRAKQGYFIGSVPSYGYKIEKVTRGQVLVVDENVRDVIEYIYEQALKDKSYTRIAKELNDKGITPPMVYYKTNRKYRVTGDKEWYPGAINKILHNEVYYGTMIQGKKSQNLAKNKKQEFLDKKDWIIMENNHEAIIEKEVFLTINELKRNNPHSIKSKVKHPGEDPINRYYNLIYTKEDGSRMGRTFRYKKSGDLGRVYYFYNNKNRSSSTEQGKTTYINEATLEEIVRQSISILLQKIESKKRLLTNVEHEKQVLLKIHDESIIKHKNRIDYQKNIQQDLYESYFSGDISKDEYMSKKQISKNKEKMLQEEITNIEIKKNDIELKSSDLKIFVKNLYEAKGQQKLSGELIHSIIKRIEVSIDKEVKITFKYDI